MFSTQCFQSIQTLNLNLCKFQSKIFKINKSAKHKVNKSLAYIPSYIYLTQFNLYFLYIIFSLLQQQVLGPSDNCFIKNKNAKYTNGSTTLFQGKLSTYFSHSFRGVINVHGSILPRYRGAAPIPYAILNGDTSTGITIMEVKPFQ